MLIPKKVKHRKWHKKAGHSGGRMASRAIKLSYGSFGLKSMEEKWIYSRQIEAARRAMTHYLLRGGKIWIRIFPDKPITSKGNEVPMGGGKGAVEKYVVNIKPGAILFEIDGVTEEQAREAVRLAAHKLPVKCKFVSKE